MIDNITALEAQIKKLQDELSEEKKKANSLWHSVYKLLREKKILSKKSTEIANEITAMFHKQLYNKGRRSSNREFIELVNSVITSLSPEGEELYEHILWQDAPLRIVEEPEVNQSFETPELPPTNGESPPVMERFSHYSRRVNVPKPFNS